MARDLENAKRLKHEWYLRNKELTKERARAWQEANPERKQATVAKWREENRDRHNAINRDWWSRNQPKRASYQRKREAAKLMRTPAWLTDDDLWMMEQAYELAALRTQMFGFPWHVDHIIPLQGKTVSGLHVPTNLQVIPGAENVRKSNSWAEMPNLCA
jgi:hypothetical protein